MTRIIPRPVVLLGREPPAFLLLNVLNDLLWSACRKFRPPDSGHLRLRQCVQRGRNFLHVAIIYFDK